MQVEHNFQVKDYYQLILTTISYFKGNFAPDVRLWKCSYSEDELRKII